MPGNYVSESMTEAFIECEFKRRFNIEWVGMHRAFLIHAQTGKGKNHFVHYVLRPLAARLGKKVLYLCNRKALGEQEKKGSTPELVET